MGSLNSEKIIRKPVHKELFEGAIVDIYNREGALQGQARLIQRSQSRSSFDGLPYVKHERDSRDNKKRDSYCHVWSYERWLVEWESHKYYRKGFRNCTEVNYYMYTKINPKSGYEINDIPEDSANKYLFVEEKGVLITLYYPKPIIKELYPKRAIKALDKACKIFGSNLVMYSEDPDRAREKVKNRILTFLDIRKTFEEAIADYVEKVNSKDFMILAGTSRVQHTRTFQIDPRTGLYLNKESRSKYA